jgi:hypothetical protein
MDTKAEITRLWRDVQASAREFASLGLASSIKALEATSTGIKALEEKLKGTAEKLKKNGEPEVTIETKASDSTVKQ